MLFRTRTALPLITLLALTSAARATLLFSDSFSYTPGSLVGDTNAGQSWTNEGAVPTVTSPGLSYPGLASSGNEVVVPGSGFGGAGINLPATAGGTANAGSAPVIWLSFLMNEQSSDPAPAGYAVVSLNNASTSLGVGMLNDADVYGIDDNVNVQPPIRATSDTRVNNTLHLVVAEFDFTAGREYVYIDPTLGATAPNSTNAPSVAMLSAIQTGGFTGLGVFAGNNADTFNIDEIKLGTSFADVANTTYLLGDANLDGKVDLTDLNIVLNHLGTTDSLRADGNFDGAPTIDLTDLNDVLNNLGVSAPAPTIPAPEPASLSLLLLSAPLLRRRKY